MPIFFLAKVLTDRSQKTENIEQFVELQSCYCCCDYGLLIKIKTFILYFSLNFFLQKLNWRVRYDLAAIFKFLPFEFEPPLHNQEDCYFQLLEYHFLNLGHYYSVI